MKQLYCVIAAMLFRYNGYGWRQRTTYTFRDVTCSRNFAPVTSPYIHRNQRRYHVKNASLNETARNRRDFIWTQWKTHHCTIARKSVLPTFCYNVCTATTERACLNTILQACRHVLNGNPFVFILVRNILWTKCVKRKTEFILIEKHISLTSKSPAVAYFI
jgi:hypothetical protein